MPAEQPPDIIAGSTIRITRAGSACVGSKRLAAVGRVLLVTCVVSSVAGAALATYGLWQLASTVQDMVQFAVSVEDVANIEPTARAGARTPSVAPGFPEPASIPLQLASSPAGAEVAEASETPVSIGAPSWPQYVRTECTGVFVYIVTTSVDSPMYSAASLGSTETGRARFRRAGQMLGDWEVLAITDDWTGLNPGVWLVKDWQVCRAELAGNPSRVHVALQPPTKKRKPRKRRPRGRRR